jgi:Uma2 family endonuclease
MSTVESLSTSDLKLREEKYAVYLDRLGIADYRNYCDDPKITAAGFLPSRLVWVWDQHNKLIAVYLATGKDDGFMPQRQQILRDEIKYQA